MRGLRRNNHEPPPRYGSATPCPYNSGIPGARTVALATSLSSAAQFLPRQPAARDPVFEEPSMSWSHFLRALFGKQQTHQSSPHNHRLSRVRGKIYRPALERLEDRLAPANLLVTNIQDVAPLNPGTNDPHDQSGLVSVRSAIAAANVDAQNSISDTITFDPSLAGQTVGLTQPLEISAGSTLITINGGGQITIGNSA